MPNDKAGTKSKRKAKPLGEPDRVKKRFEKKTDCVNIFFHDQAFINFSADAQPI